MKLKNESKGITLIALVITIIVLIILAGISIAMLTGENGILTKAQSASEQTKYSNAKEKVNLAASGSRDANGLNYGDLQTNINQIEGLKDKVGTITQSSFPIKVNVDGYDFEISDVGKVTPGDGINWDEILDNAKNPNPDQSESNKTIGVGTDGELVNMDLWLSEKEEEGYTLRGEQGTSSCSSAYLGEFVDGEIQGTVPQYIKKERDENFYPVIAMEYTFESKDELKVAPKIPETVTDISYAFLFTNLLIAPEIPSGVTNMEGTFWGCKKMTQTSKIPKDVTNMQDTFAACNSLTEAPEIPSGVTNMESTFSFCENLIKGPKIPDSVTNMKTTFWRCNNLTGELIIDANPTYYNDCLNQAANRSGTNLVLKGKSTMLEELKATAGTGSHITIGN